MTTQTSAPIGATGQSLEGVAVNTAAGSNLFRESVVAADANDPNAYAGVVSSQPSSSATPYGLVAWIAGTPNFSSTVNVTTSVNITTLAATSTQIVSSLPIWVSQSSAPWTINGSINVSAGGAAGVQYSSGTVTSVPTGTLSMGFFNNTTTPLALDASGNLNVNVAAGGTAGVQYVKDTVTTKPTGTVSMGLNSVNSTEPLLIDGSGNLLVNVAAGGTAGVQYSSGAVTSTPTGTVMMGFRSNTTRPVTLDANNSVNVNVTSMAAMYSQNSTVTTPFGVVAMGYGRVDNSTRALSLDLNGNLYASVTSMIGVYTYDFLQGGAPTGMMMFGTKSNSSRPLRLDNTDSLVVAVSSTPGYYTYDFLQGGAPNGLMMFASKTNSSRPLLLDLNDRLKVTVESTVAVGGSGVQYSSGAVTSTPTGTVAFGFFNNSTKPLTLDASNNLNVNVVAGGTAGTQYLQNTLTTAPTGTIAMGLDVNNSTRAVGLASTGALLVSVVSTVGGGSSGGGTQYLQGATTSAPTGTVAMGYSAGSTWAINTDTSGTQLINIISSLPLIVSQSSAPWTINGSINVSAGGTAGTQYLQNTVTTAPTGTIAMAVNAANSTRSLVVDANDSLKVNIASTVPQNILGAINISSATAVVSTALVTFGTTAVFLGQTTGAFSMPVVLASNVTTGVQITSSLPLLVAQSTNPWTMNLTQVGSTTVLLGATTNAFSIPVVIASNQASVLVTASQSSPPWQVTISSRANGGYTATTIALANNLNTTVIKTGATTLYDFHMGNMGSTNCFVRLYDSSTAANVIASTSIAKYTFASLSSTVTDQTFATPGLAFSTGITIITQQQPYTATTSIAPPASSVVLSIGYL